MQNRGGSLRKTLNEQLFKNTLVFFVFLISFYIFVVYQLYEQEKKIHLNGVNSEFQLDMGALELLTVQRWDAINQESLRVFENFKVSYHQQDAIGFPIDDLTSKAVKSVYIINDKLDVLQASQSNASLEDISRFFEDFGNRGIEKIVLEGVHPLGIVNDPRTRELSYACLMPLSESTYKLLAMIGLNDLDQELISNSLMKSEKRYNLIPFVLKTEDPNPAFEKQSYNFLGSNKKGLLSYTFNKGTDYEYTIYAEALMISGYFSVFIKSVLVLDLIFILLSFWFVFIFNKRLITKSLVLMETANDLFKRSDLSSVDIITEEYNVREIEEFMCIIKEMLESTEDLMMQRDLQNKVLLTQNEEVILKNRKLRTLLIESEKTEDLLHWQLQTQHEKLYHVVKSLMYVIELRDGYTRGHCDRVEFYAIIIATRMNFSLAQIENIKYGAMLHDLGKIKIKENLLNKSTKVTISDTEEFKQHPLEGYAMIKDLDFCDEVKWIVLQHHERLDGTGYPSGLKGNEIHPLAKIVAVADAFDAMTSNRPYRKMPLSRHEAINELQCCSEKQFDAEIVKVFIDYLISEENLE